MDRDHRSGLAGGTPAEARLLGRLGSRLVAGGVGGAAIGLALGAIIGFLAFDRAGATWASVLGGGIFGLAVGMLVFAYSSLESPDPGAEPSDTERPVADRPEAVREEQPRRPAEADGATENITADGSTDSADTS